MFTLKNAIAEDSAASPDSDGRESTTLEDLAAEAIRRARIATALHLAGIDSTRASASDGEAST